MDQRGQREGIFRRIWRSVFRGPVVPTTDRDRRWIVFNTLVLHLRPIQLPARTLRYTHTFGLGGMSLVLVLLLFATGILMMFVYEPSPEAAYDSIVSLQDDVLFGRLVRGVHHWSANLLVVVVLLHLLRVFLTGGYHGPRQFNWVVGLGPSALRPGRPTSPATCCRGTSSRTGRSPSPPAMLGLRPLDRRAAAAARSRRAGDRARPP